MKQTLNCAEQKLCFNRTIIALIVLGIATVAFAIVACLGVNAGLHGNNDAGLVGLAFAAFTAFCGYCVLFAKDKVAKEVVSHYLIKRDGYCAVR